LAELTSIHVRRGLDPPLAQLVTEKLMSSDALGAHARDELGITESSRARPIQAAFASAISFASGAIIPIAATLLVPSARIGEVLFATALVALVILGGTAAYAAGASIAKGAMRAASRGSIAMGLKAGVDRLFDAGL
jgi:VIT1/CCC1 family predicted Fe2+/Mn2+ transporter